MLLQDSLQDEELVLWNIKSLAFLLKLPTKTLLVPLIYIQRHLFIWSPPENPISHWQPQESKLAIWDLALPLSCHHFCLSFQLFFLTCSGQTKLFHTHPEYQSHSAIRCSARLKC